MMKAYLANESKALFINPANLVPEGITNTIDTNINALNGRPTVEYNGETVEIFVTEASYKREIATVSSLMEVANNGNLTQKGGNIRDKEVSLHNYLDIVELYEALLEKEASAEAENSKK